jgi:hypothetical protein
MEFSLLERFHGSTSGSTISHLCQFSEMKEAARRPLTAYICRTSAFVGIGIAITAATAAPEVLDKRRRVEGRDTGTRNRKLMNVGAALAQRASGKQRQEKHQQGMSASVAGG